MNGLEREREQCCGACKDDIWSLKLDGYIKRGMVVEGVEQLKWEKLHEERSH